MTSFIPKKLFEELAKGESSNNLPMVKIEYTTANPEEVAKYIRDSMMQVVARGKFREPTEREKKIFPGVKRIVTDMDIESVNMVPKEESDHER